MTIVTVAFLICRNVSAQDRQADSLGRAGKTPVTILANVDSSVVVIDAQRLGVTPLMIDTLAPGVHHLTLHHPDVDNWLASSISDTFRVNPGIPLTLQYTLEPRYLITSAPFDAELVVGDSVIGRTPLTVGLGAKPLSNQIKTLSVRKMGFEPATLDLSSAQRGVLSVNLKRVWQRDDDQEGVFRPENGQTSHTVRLTLSAASTLLSGAAAAYFKIKADDRYQSYRDTGDPARLSQTHRLDTAAAIAFVATQISLGLFTYFVLSN
jgi:hypothetical protein